MYSISTSALSLFGVLVVVGLRPRIVGVEQARRSRDDLAHIELNLLEQPALVQFWVEALSAWQRQTRLAPRPPSQRLIRSSASRDGRHDHDARDRLEAKRRRWLSLDGDSARPRAS